MLPAPILFRVLPGDDCIPPDVSAAVQVLSKQISYNPNWRQLPDGSRIFYTAPRSTTGLHVYPLPDVKGGLGLSLPFMAAPDDFLLARALLSIGFDIAGKCHYEQLPGQRLERIPLSDADLQSILEEQSTVFRSMLEKVRGGGAITIPCAVRPLVIGPRTAGRFKRIRYESAWALRDVMCGILYPKKYNFLPRYVPVPVAGGHTAQAQLIDNTRWHEVIEDVEYIALRDAATEGPLFEYNSAGELVICDVPPPVVVERAMLGRLGFKLEPLDDFHQLINILPPRRWSRRIARLRRRLG